VLYSKERNLEEKDDIRFVEQYNDSRKPYFSGKFNLVYSN